MPPILPCHTNEGGPTFVPEEKHRHHRDHLPENQYSIIITSYAKVT